MFDQTDCRLFVLIARQARVAAIFRHSAKNLTRLIRWDLQTDSFQPGQWFKGTIFDRFADLSPEGDFLVYYARKPGQQLTIPAWTAVSRPPYFTALAMWPQARVDAGGGLFDAERTIRLNHRADDMALAKGFKLRKGMVVTRRAWDASAGQDLYHERLMRDGWTLTDPALRYDFRNTVSPLYEKRSAAGVVVMMQTKRQGGPPGNRDQADYDVVLPDDSVWLRLSGTDWVDWDQNGDLLTSQKGCLFRVSASDIGSSAGPAALRCIADFRKMVFAPVKPPPEAVHWHYETTTPPTGT